MKTLLSKEECAAKAQGVLDFNKKSDSVIVFVDGTSFLGENQNAADNYGVNATAAGKEALKSYTFDREAKVEVEGTEEENAWKGLTIAEIKERVATIDEIEVLEVGFELTESKGGKEAIQDRIAELTV